MEAGIEHLGRGTAEGVDTLLVVTDADKKSRDAASAIIRLARASSIRDIMLVGNRVAGERDAAIISSCARENDVSLAILIPYDSDVAEAGITGDVIDHKASAAKNAVSTLAGHLEETAGTGNTMRGQDPGRPV